ncbi:MAG: hypothetical protein Q9160_007535 [Pyrenula sp. 1 TL-2023]
MLDLLPIDQVQLQRRQIGLLIGIGVGLRYYFLGIILAFGAAKVLKDAYHAPYSNNLVEVHPPTAASAYAIVPSADASPTIITVQPSDTPDPTPSVGPGDGHGFTINVPPDLAQRTDDLAGQNSGGCPAPKIRRSSASLQLGKRDDLDPRLVLCLYGLTITLVRNMVTGPLAQWARTNNNRNVAPTGAGAAVLLGEIRQELSPLQQQIGASLEVFDRMIYMGYWEAYAQLVRQQRPGQLVRITEDDITRNFCPRERTLNCANQLCKGRDQKCADDSLLKTCRCVDEEEDEGSCDPKVPPAPGFFKNDDDLKAVQQALLNLKDLPDAPPDATDSEDAAPPHCELRKRAGVSIDRDFFKSLVNTVCKDFPGDPDKSFDKKLTNKDAEPKYQDSFSGYSIELKWDDKPGSCDPLNCVKIFSDFVDGASTQCTPDPHSMAQSGTIDLSCGTAKFTISEAEPPPTNCPVMSLIYGTTCHCDQALTNNN